MAQILVIDDEAAFRDGLIETLTDLGQRAIGAGSVREGIARLAREHFDAVFVDFRMPDINGIEAIKLIREKTQPHPVPVVMITAFIDGANTIEAMRLGAFDHLTKPIGRADIERVLQSLIRAYPDASEAGPASAPSLGDDAIVGKSSAIREVLKLIGRLAASDSSVLITGETGTGKELVAKAIHANSARAKGPFVAVNCAAIPENLLESELFGHTRGAFTGATNERKGSFQLADGGTLLLDEIGDMNLNLQAKLLRSLQEKEVTPVGSSRPLKINVRFLAATHQNLPELVEKKEFRADLYYRLNVVEIHLPSLRERPEDILPLAEHFLSLAAGSSAPKTLSGGAREKLRQHSWPGNIRELKNLVERASVFARGAAITEDDIQFLSSTRPEECATPRELDLPRAVAQLERSMITRALAAAEGNRSEAARKLGIQRQLLYTKMKEYEIDSW